MDERIHKLPKWAQGIIEQQARRLKTVENLLTDREESPVYQGHRAQGDYMKESRRFLRADSSITFEIKGERESIQVSLQGAHSGHRGLFIYASGLNQKMLAFMPSSSNTGFLVLVDRKDRGDKDDDN